MNKTTFEFAVSKGIFFHPSPIKLPLFSFVRKEIDGKIFYDSRSLELKTEEIEHFDCGPSYIFRGTEHRILPLMFKNQGLGICIRDANGFELGHRWFSLADGCECFEFVSCGTNIDVRGSQRIFLSNSSFYDFVSREDILCRLVSYPGTIPKTFSDQSFFPIGSATLDEIESKTVPLKHANHPFFVQAWTKMPLWFLFCSFNEDCLCIKAENRAMIACFKEMAFRYSTDEIEMGTRIYSILCCSGVLGRHIHCDHDVVENNLVFLGDSNLTTLSQSMACWRILGELKDSLKEREFACLCIVRSRDGTHHAFPAIKKRGKITIIHLCNSKVNYFREMYIATKTMIKLVKVDSYFVKDGPHFSEWHMTKSIPITNFCMNEDIAQKIIARSVTPKRDVILNKNFMCDLMTTAGLDIPTQGIVFESSQELKSKLTLFQGYKKMEQCKFINQPGFVIAKNIKGEQF